jgi:Ca2+-binding EF-hand superfamily protein
MISLSKGMRSKDSAKDPYDELAKAFAMVDKDRSGHLTLDELVAVIEKMGMEVPITHVQEVFFELMDEDGDGTVSFKEFTKKLKQYYPSP